MPTTVSVSWIGKTCLSGVKLLNKTGVLINGIFEIKVKFGKY